MEYKNIVTELIESHIRKENETLTKEVEFLRKQLDHQLRRQHRLTSRLDRALDEVDALRSVIQDVVDNQPTRNVRRNLIEDFNEAARDQQMELLLDSEPETELVWNHSTGMFELVELETID